MIYPSGSGWITQYNQSKFVQDYNKLVQSAHPTALEQLADARRYNDALSSGALLEANSNIPTGSGTSSNGVLPYRDMLVAGNGVMSRLKIPAIDLDLPIYHGTSEDTLLKGLGHLEGTSLPVGGVNTHSVVTGHRGLASATMFTHLDKVQVGDQFSFETFGEVLVYSVTSTKVVAPQETETLRQEAGKDLVTLVTCTPLGINTHRILVTAERITPTPPNAVEQASAKPTTPHFPWWIVFLGLAVTATGLYLWRAGYRDLAPAQVSGAQEFAEKEE